MIEKPVRTLKVLTESSCPTVNWVYRLVTIFLSSLLFAASFWFLFVQVRHLVVTNIILIPAVIIAWFWGRRAGILTVLICTFWISMIIPKVDPSQREIYSAAIGTFSYLIITILSGTASTLIKKLKRENRERMKVEEQLKRYQEQLEEMVEERTEELTQAHEKLSQIEKMEAIGQLAGGIAHDFNNQLAVILGYSDILAYRLEDPKLSRFARQIHLSGTRASDLTKQLLAFSRKSSYKPKIVDLNALVTEVITLLSRSVNKSISLLHVLDSRNPKVWGSASHLQNAILNLALNARDAMTEGGVLTIETSDVYVDETFCSVQNIRLETGNYACVAVTDTGTGIDPEVRDKIFEPFFTTKAEGKGTGMGLAAVYGTIESHEGTILVQSEPGRGSTFRLLLPVTTRKDNEVELTDELGETADGEHVLIIEEEPDIAEMFSVILRTLNYRTTVAEKDKAVDLYSEIWRQVDLVLMNEQLSSENKYQLYRSLKVFNSNLTAVISSSGISSTKQIEAALNEGISGLLQKPFTRKDIHRKIQECLRKNKHA
ncbi:MAG: ATP-binding protein, partial [Chitinispirillaceae bacterium]